MIHYSHSKKDLVEIIEVFEFWDIIDYRDLCKEDLKKTLWDYLRECKSIPADDEFFFINDVAGLMKYLNSPCPKQHMTDIKERDISDKCRNLIFYSKECSHSITASNFVDIDEIIQSAHEIAKYGNLPLVRRALNLLNQDGKINDKIQPILTKRMRKKVEKQELIKKQNISRLKVKKGNVWVIFD